MVIATRRLTLHLPNQEIEVAIRIFLPVEHHGSWSCSYEIDWPNGTKSHAATGFDSVQAILLALQLIGTEIYTSDYHNRGQLGWPRPNQGYGFPVPKTVRDLLIGADRDL
jgi:hypothetical protein